MPALRLTSTIVRTRDPLFRHPFARWAAIASCALLGGTWVAVLAIPMVPGDDAIILHYSTTFGIDALGSWEDLLRLPVTGTVIAVVNFLVAWEIERRGATHRAVGERDRPRVLGLGPMTTALAIATMFLEFGVLLAAILLWCVNITRQ